jgi:hypothetical protein
MARDDSKAVPTRVKQREGGQPESEPVVALLPTIEKAVDEVLTRERADAELEKARVRLRNRTRSGSLHRPRS